MRCPNCQNDHKKKYGMICSCGYRFVFNPTSDQLTDGKFQAILNAASAGDTQFFTFNGLYATFCRKQSYSRFRLGAGMVAGIGFALAGAGTLAHVVRGGDAPDWWPVSLFILPLGVILIFFTARRFTMPPASPEHVRTLLERWQSGGHKVSKLLSKPGLHEPPPDWPEADIYDYGAERVLIVEHDLLVDWLVMNNVHATERTVILSQHGYPEYILPRVEEMLKNKPDLPVFLLHDATPAGEAMVMELMEGYHRLSHLLTGHPITDLGLSAADARTMGAFRALKPKHSNYEVPLDYVPYGMLSSGLASAMALGVPLHELPRRSDDDGGSTGGFG